MKVLMFPHATQMPATSGIGQVIHNYFRYLPQFGIELVGPQSSSYDIRVSHAGVVTDADVVHNHGLYWSADFAACAREYATNARIVVALRNAKEVTVPSRWVAENIARDMRFLPHVVPHGINWKEWQHSKSNEGYVIGYNKNRKGIDACDPTFADELAGQSPNIKFVNTFANTSLANISLTGIVPHAQMKSIIQGCSVYVSTIKETGGIGILEAMASGKPILGFAEGAILDLVEHEVHGYLAQPGNMEDLTLGLHFCLEHQVALGQNAREHARAFTWEKVCEQIAEIYSKAIIVEPATCSIIIPTFNYSDRVSSAIHSAQLQDYPLLKHIVVVDDGSTDDGATEKVVTSLAESDSRIHYIRQANSGVANARNTGISVVGTKYICCLDADDMIEPSYLSTLIPSLEADPSLGIAYSPIQIVGLGNRKPFKGSWPGNFDYDRQVAGHNQISTCCVFRREMWRRLGGYRERYSPMGAGTEDAEFWLRAGSIGYNARLATDKPLFLYSMGTGLTAKSSYNAPNWLSWHPWTYNADLHPFASLATPAHGKTSHAVRQYDQPEISIIIPVGPRHEHMLIDALDSLEAQTYYKWEVVIANDTGHTLDLTAYPYARVVSTGGKRGPGYARNRAIEVSRAPLFVCLDADDYLQPTALEAFMAAHAANPDAWIYPDMYIWKIGGIMEEYHTQDWDVHTLWRKGIALVTCLYLKSHWESVGGYDENIGREDQEFHLRLANAGHCGLHLPRILFTYRYGTGTRRSEDSITAESSKLRKIYSEEKLQMACRSCGERRARLPKPDNWELKEESQVTTETWPLIEYLGRVSTDQLFKGRLTGRAYMFAANIHNRYHRVHPGDAKFLLRFPYFRQIENVPNARGGNQERVLMAAPMPTETKVENMPPPISYTPLPPPPVTQVPLARENADGQIDERVEIQEPNFVMPDFDKVGNDYDIEGLNESTIDMQADAPPDISPSTSVSIDVGTLTVADILSGHYASDEIHSIYKQELASAKPRVTIVRWAKKEIGKLSTSPPE